MARISGVDLPRENVLRSVLLTSTELVEQAPTAS